MSGSHTSKPKTAEGLRRANGAGRLQLVPLVGPKQSATERNQLSRQLTTRHQGLGRQWLINPAASLKLGHFGNAPNPVARRYARFSRRVNPLARIWRILRRQPLPQNETNYNDVAYQSEFEPDYLDEYEPAYASPSPPTRPALANSGFLGRPALRTFKTLTPAILAQPASNVQRNLNQSGRNLPPDVENPDFSKPSDFYSEIIGPPQSGEFYPADSYPQTATYSAAQSFYPEANFQRQARSNLTYRNRARQAYNETVTNPPSLSRQLSNDNQPTSLIAPIRVANPVAPLVTRQQSTPRQQTTQITVANPVAPLVTMQPTDLSRQGVNVRNSPAFPSGNFEASRAFHPGMVDVTSPRLSINRFQPDAIRNEVRNYTNFGASVFTPIIMRYPPAISPTNPLDVANEQSGRPLRGEPAIVNNAYISNTIGQGGASAPVPDFSRTTPPRPSTSSPRSYLNNQKDTAAAQSYPFRPLLTTQDYQSQPAINRNYLPFSQSYQSDPAIKRSYQTFVADNSQSYRPTSGNLPTQPTSLMAAVNPGNIFAPALVWQQLRTSSGLPTPVPPLQRILTETAIAPPKLASQNYLATEYSPFNFYLPNRPTSNTNPAGSATPTAFPNYSLDANSSGATPLRRSQSNFASDTQSSPAFELLQANPLDIPGINRLLSARPTILPPLLNRTSLLERTLFNQPITEIANNNTNLTRTFWRDTALTFTQPTPLERQTNEPNYRTNAEVGTSNLLNFPPASQNNYFGRVLSVTDAATPTFTSAVSLVRALSGQLDHLPTVQNWPNADRASPNRSVTEFEPVVMRYPLAADFARSGSAHVVAQPGSQLPDIAARTLSNQNSALPLPILGAFAQPDRFNPYISSNQTAFPTLDQLSTSQPQTQSDNLYSVISNPQFPYPTATTENAIRRLTAQTNQPYLLQNDSNIFAPGIVWRQLQAATVPTEAAPTLPNLVTAPLSNGVNRGINAAPSGNTTFSTRSNINALQPNLPAIATLPRSILRTASVSPVPNPTLILRVWQNGFATDNYLPMPLSFKRPENSSQSETSFVPAQQSQSKWGTANTPLPTVASQTTVFRNRGDWPLADQLIVSNLNRAVTDTPLIGNPNWAVNDAPLIGNNISTFEPIVMRYPLLGDGVTSDTDKGWQSSTPIRNNPARSEPASQPIQKIQPGASELFTTVGLSQGLENLPSIFSNRPGQINRSQDNFQLTTDGLSQGLENMSAIFSNRSGQISRTAKNFQPPYQIYQANQQIDPGSSIFAPAQVWRQLRSGETERAGKAKVNLWERALPAIGMVDRLQTRATPSPTNGFATDLSQQNSDEPGSTMNYIVPPLFALKAGAAAPQAIARTSFEDEAGFAAGFSDEGKRAVSNYGLPRNLLPPKTRNRSDTSSAFEPGSWETELVTPAASPIRTSISPKQNAADNLIQTDWAVPPPMVQRANNNPPLDWAVSAPETKQRANTNPYTEWAASPTLQQTEATTLPLSRDISARWGTGVINTSQPLALIQRKAADVAQVAVTKAGIGLEASVLRTSIGKPIERSLQTQMSSIFRRNFEDVRVHDNEQAGNYAKQIGAEAFTVGSNIFFGANRYQPHTQTGQALLGHELTHVVQQASLPSLSGGRVLETSGQGRAFEHEAMRNESLILKHLETSQTRPGSEIQRVLAPAEANSAALSPVTTSFAPLTPAHLQREFVASNQSQPHTNPLETGTASIVSRFVPGNLGEEVEADKPAKEQEVDLEALAQQVLRLLKKEMIVERERRGIIGHTLF